MSWHARAMVEQSESGEDTEQKVRALPVMDTELRMLEVRGSFGMRESLVSPA
jgi:hypothetical protein